MTSRRPSLATVATWVVATGTFVSSFATIADYAVRVGVATPLTSWAWPLAVDGTVIVAAMRARDLRAQGEPTWAATSASVAALCASVAVNVAHAPRTTSAGLMAALVPSALAICLFLLLHGRGQALATPGQEDGQTVAAPDRDDDAVATDGQAVASPGQGGGQQVATGGQDDDVVASDGQEDVRERLAQWPPDRLHTSAWPPEELTPEAARLLVLEAGSVSAAAKRAGMPRSSFRRLLVDSDGVST